MGGHKVPIYPYRVTPEFFQTMGIPLVRGRNLLPGEENAVIVSESLARIQWPGRTPWANMMLVDGARAMLWLAWLETRVWSR